MNFNHGQYLILTVFQTKHITNQYVLEYYLSLVCQIRMVHSLYLPEIHQTRIYDVPIGWFTLSHLFYNCQVTQLPRLPFFCLLTSIPVYIYILSLRGGV